MNTNKTTARIVGALFLIAMVTSLVGDIWLLARGFSASAPATG